MGNRSWKILLLVLALQMVVHISCLDDPRMMNPDVRSELEDKVVSSMSLKDLEYMVENNARVLDAPKSRMILMPRNRDPRGHVYLIERKPRTGGNIADDINERSEGFQLADEQFDVDFKKPLDSGYGFRDFRLDDFPSPSFFDVPDLESAGSHPANDFYGSAVESLVGEMVKTYERNPMEIIQMAASERRMSVPQGYNYEGYQKPSKVKAKYFWKPERREEKIDENGCRTIVKKIMDPEDEKKPNSAKAKSVIITKECEYPTVNGPDAKLPEMDLPMRLGESRLTAVDSEPSTYSDSRPDEMAYDSSKPHDPLAPDYVDKMLETHFRSFPTFNNPLSSFQGYQDRFKLRSPEPFSGISMREPEGFKDIKPTIKTQSYEFASPVSGFERDSGSESSSFEDSRQEDSPYRDMFKAPVYEKQSPKITAPQFHYDSAEPVEKKSSPKVTEHHYHYDSAEPVEKKSSPKVTEHQYHYDSAEPVEKKSSPKVTEHHYHYDSSDDDNKKTFPKERETEEDGIIAKKSKKDPKMVKKSFAYYRKDNPKEDPNDQQFAEEFAHGNFRSFSSSYDSDRDDPKKQ